ncbi:MAG: lipoate--protein ligase family protein [Bacillota bacterium]|nr:biotin/lipoate A/B protein ligase family protein [Bacillota bacterium]HPT60889.1 biotin/lipoate A/B protein ligase family protein [Bacillota bacterium]
MKLFVDPPLPGKTNMEIDLELVEKAAETGSAYVRLYSWSRPTISLGYFQKPEKVLDFSALEKHGIDWVRRPTGGRAVFHFKEITYSVSLPEDYPGLPSSVTEAYRFISEPIYRAFLQIGLPVKWARQEENVSEACFLAPARHEIILQGKKVVGSAQRRKARSVLQHGSILLGAQPEVFADCLLGVDKEVFLEQLRTRTMVIPVREEELRKSLIYQFRRFFS